MNNLYIHYKNLFESVKPIRGRAEDTRPIGKRRRDWETIRMVGDVVECVLYQTPVVRYFPDGSVGLQCNGWVSPSTAEFMHEHSPFYARKRSNRIWVSHSRESTAYPLPNRDEVKFVLTADNKWAPHEPILITKKVVNRNKAKEARAPYKLFLNYVETFLKMSDGWVSDALRAEVGTRNPGNWGDAYDFGVGTYFYKADARAIQSTLDMILRAEDGDYLRPMCALLQQMEPTERKLVRIEKSENPRMRDFNDLRYDHKLVRAKLYRMIEKCEDMHEEVEVKYG
jgi:hypothetical protein